MAPRLGWNESHRSSPGDKMKFSSLLPLPKGHLRKRSKARSEISPSKDKVKLILPYQVHTHTCVPRNQLQTFLVSVNSLSQDLTTLEFRGVSIAR